MGVGDASKSRGRGRAEKRNEEDWLTLVVPLHLRVSGHDGAEETGLGVEALVVGLGAGGHGCG